MADINASGLRQILAGTVGPAPWYWETFPSLISASGQRFGWTYHGDQGMLAYLVSLHREDEPDRPLLALNIYCRPFVVPPTHLGIWCPEGRSIRFLCFDPDRMRDFDFAEIAGWFKQSNERVYAVTAPIVEFEPPALGPSTHNIEVPAELQTVDELIVPASYPVINGDDPAFALYVFYLRAGLLEVLPQKWFTPSQYDVGRQWIPRAARDPRSHRIFGECFGAGTFLLQEDGCRLDRWIEKRV